MLQVILSITAVITITLCSLFIGFKWRSDKPSLFLMGALLTTAAIELFDTLAMMDASLLPYGKRGAMMVEGILPGIWLLYSLTFARTSNLSTMSRAAKLLLLGSPLLIIAASVLPLDALFYSPDLLKEKILFLNGAGFVFYLLMMAFLVIPLVNLEITLVTASPVDRWKIKFEILGTAALLAVLIFYYSQGLLYRTINMNLVPVRSVMMVAAALFITYSRLRRSETVTVFVSREMAFRSIAFFAVGIYLVWLGLLGEGMKYFDTEGRRALLIALFFLSGVALVLVFLSEAVRRKVRVFVHKHFYRNKYDYRAQWLQFTARLAAARSREELLRSILSAFSEIFGTEGATLFLDDNHRMFRAVARYEMDPIIGGISLDSKLIALLRDKEWIFSLSGTDAHGIDNKDIEFLKQNAIAFIVPLVSSETVDGFIALGIPINTNEVYIYEDFDLMKTLARQANSAILNLKLSEQLTRAREMEAIGKVSAFVIHDLKNLGSTLSLIIDNAANHISNPDFQKDMLASISSTVLKMKELIARLRNFEDKQVLNDAPTDLLTLAENAARMIPTGEVVVNGASTLAKIDPEQMQKVLLNLFLNALDATEGKESPITVEVGSDDVPFIRVMDHGIGMTRDFLDNHLFKPFHSTKSKGLGIGLYQCRQIVEAHGGRIEVESQTGEGTVFSIFLPPIAPSVP